MRATLFEDVGDLFRALGFFGEICGAHSFGVGLRSQSSLRLRLRMRLRSRSRSRSEGGRSWTRGVCDMRRAKGDGEGRRSKVEGRKGERRKAKGETRGDLLVRGVCARRACVAIRDIAAMFAERARWEDPLPPPRA